jgi:alpha-1,6-mannosyltransferase
MRICDLTTLYIDGGAGGVNTYLREKSSFLARLDGSIEHTVIVPAATSERRRLFNSTVHAVKSPALPWNRQHRLLVNLGEVKKILKRAAPDVVEVDCAYLLPRLAARALDPGRTPVIGFYHVHLPFHAARAGGRLHPALARRGEGLAWRYLRFCARPLTRLVVPSLDILERLRARGLERLEHVPLGVNLDLFHPLAGDGREGPARQVLYVGRLSEEKDLRLLFQAYAALAAAQRDLRLVVVGDGPLRPLVEALARSRSDVTVSGLCPYGPELARLYHQADVLAVPSPNETFGLTVLEAFASGLPVVATRRGGPVELVTPEVGALARPGDAADLAEKLGAVLARGSWTRRCRRHAERHYSWDRTFKRLLEVYAGAGSSPPNAPDAVAGPVEDPVAGAREIAHSTLNLE